MGNFLIFNFELMNITNSLEVDDKQVFRVNYQKTVENIRFTILNNWGHPNITCVGLVQLFGSI